MTLIEASIIPSDPPQRLWVPDGWDTFVYRGRAFKRAPTARSQEPVIQQWLGGAWRPVTVLTRTTQGEAA